MALPMRRSREVSSWDPFRELDTLHTRFNNLLESAFGEVPMDSSPGAWHPPIDIEETDDAFIVEADLPGVQPGDVDVELHDNQLTVHGEIKERERTGLVHRSTRRTGQFDYRVTLPTQVDGDQVEASMKDGVLRLELRKVEAAKPRRIQISGS
jgi:HSP20 family protein